MVDRNLRPGDLLTRLDAAPQRLGGRIARVVQEEVRSHLLVGVHDLADQVRSGLLPVPEVRRGDQPLDVELVGVEHQPDERLPVIGFGDASGQAADVGEDDQPGLETSCASEGAGVRARMTGMSKSF